MSSDHHRSDNQQPSTRSPVIQRSSTHSKSPSTPRNNTPVMYTTPITAPTKRRRPPSTSNPIVVDTTPTNLISSSQQPVATIPTPRSLSHMTPRRLTKTSSTTSNRQLSSPLTPNLINSLSSSSFSESSIQQQQQQQNIHHQSFLLSCSNSSPSSASSSLSSSPACTPPRSHIIRRQLTACPPAVRKQASQRIRRKLRQRIRHEIQPRRLTFCDSDDDDDDDEHDDEHVVTNNNNTTATATTATDNQSTITDLVDELNALNDAVCRQRCDEFRARWNFDPHQGPLPGPWMWQHVPAESQSQDG